MSNATEPRLPAQPAKSVEGAPAPGYRSIADGELASTWTLKDYFANLNTVMRLPGKVRRKMDKVEKRIEQKTGLKLPNIKVPPIVVAAGFLMALGVFVVRPLMLSASSSEPVGLSQAFGVWEAGTGRYAGRMFELGEHSIAFRTSSQSPDYTWHRVTDVRTREASDSTLFTVLYDEDGKEAEFAFWYVPGKKPVIRLKNTPDVTWILTPYEPIARPRA
ncbi:MAG: hypothetical protein JNM53_05575 [Gemmatimonadetes bacterium]|nr:hypothetical protein [Gemmatimonadota bacterium]